MKANDHFRKAEHFLTRQQRLDVVEDSEIITSACHAAAHHYVCAALEWLGHDPQRYGHKHSKHPAALRDANAPSAIREAWQDLEELRNRGLYGGGVDQQEAEQARTYLLRIQAWAASCRPERGVCMLTMKQRRLYQRGYAGLLAQIARLVRLAEVTNSNIGGLVLYGSTARLEPHHDSDADVLVLLCDWEDRNQGSAVVVEASSIDDIWPFSPLRTTLQASNLPADLLEQIARDGVLLYLRPGLQLPAVLQSIRPYEHWREQVERLLQQPVPA